MFEMLDVRLLLQFGYLSAACLILVINFIPALRTRFVSYGARASTLSHNGADKSSPPPTSKSRAATESVNSNRLLELIANITVNHSYFSHFYNVSLAASFFWAGQYITKGETFLYIANHCHIVPQNAMSKEQALLCWGLMIIQAGRRQAECTLLSKPSTSRMWIGHYIAGMLFYLGVSIAIWIEAAPNLKSSTFTARELTLGARAPTLKVFLGVPLFAIASGVQNDCHSYLASLRKYSLPEHPVFKLIICPHYFAECLIYLALSIVSAPTGALFNRTMLCVLAFTTLNLGITARRTKEWYAMKFGPEAVAQRWNMIPFIY